MYSSVMISMLTKKYEPEIIDSLSDLLQHQNVKIYIKKFSFIDDMSKNIPILKDLEHRFEYVVLDETGAG